MSATMPLISTVSRMAQELNARAPLFGLSEVCCVCPKADMERLPLDNGDEAAARLRR